MTSANTITRPITRHAPQWRLWGAPHNRHSHVVHLIGSWVQAGHDINQLMPYLNTHLGHVNYSDTWYYFHLVPEHFDWLTSLSEATPGPRMPEARHV